MRRSFATTAAVLCLTMIGTQPGTAQDVRLPNADRPLTGTVEFQNRWRSMAGSEDLYRSTIDLGEGPKLADFTLRYRKRSGTGGSGVLDFADIRSSSWGGEPASTVSAVWGVRDAYEATINYRRFAYFNTVPSYANPTSDLIGASQRSLDIRRGLFDAEVRIGPGRDVVPFFAFSRDDGKGPGRTTFVQDGNEFAVASETDTRDHTIRGGVYLRFDRWTGIVEAGGSRFRDDESVRFEGDNPGNRSALFFGRRLNLEDLDQQYRVRGRDRFARARFEARPLEPLTVFGQFSFSQPSVDVDYTQAAGGDFVLLRNLAFFTGESVTSTADAAWPHPSGSIGVEYRPIPGLRLTESVWFDRFHISGSSVSERTLSTDGVEGPELVEGRTERLESQLTRHRFDISYDAAPELSLHGSHSYLKATALSPGSALSDPSRPSAASNTVSAGATARFRDRLDVRADIEVASKDDVFYRSDQRQFHKFRLRVRYRLADNLTFRGSGLLWTNTNDIPDIDLEQRNRNIAANLLFVPSEGPVELIQAGYSRSTYSSDVGFLIPQTFRSDESAYRDRAHTGNLAALLRPHPRLGVQLGGNLFISSDENEDGSRTRPTRFYDAHSRVEVRIHRSVDWTAGWHWYG